MLTTAILLLSGCKKDPDSQPTVGTVAFELANVVGTKLLALDGTAYTTASGETFTVSTFKYYISNIKFAKADGSTYAAPGEYHLIDASKASTTSFTISNVPGGSYTGVSFVVGVDSTTTKADPLALAGDLNPANAMYWVWATGHIFLKLEGTVTSASPSKALTCHIGGYRQPYSAIVTATPSLNGNPLRVSAGQAPKISFSADVLKMFDGPTHFTLSTFPTTMMPSASSVQVAQNYAAGMFSVTGIQAN
ncbi:MbnP family protein [Hymenobacter sp. BRD128]|uniref:MbnP family protein n=1 Tax=Hymenobacter sp. BRD128 TaxID=2675878 RepID=UPI00349F4FC5